MSLNEEYYDYVLNDKETVSSKKILFEIVRDFKDRRGLKQEWDEIDEDVQEEIFETWLEIIESNNQDV